MAREPGAAAMAFLEGGRRARLVALDLDGTLLSSVTGVSDANAAAVREATAAGVAVVFATSRWYALAKHTAEQLGVTAPLICHNGALIRSAQDTEPLLDLLIPAEPARTIAELSDAGGYEGMVTVGNVTYIASKRAASNPERLPPGMVPADRLGRHIGGDGAQAFLFFGQGAVDGMLAGIDGRYGDVINVATGYSETFPPYMNIVHAGADKGRALRMVCERLGIAPDDAIAIGDAAPDLDMMRVAGLSIAMGNAPDEVKAEVDVVGPSNHDDGVAWAIRRFALL
jgi:hydroxymethylpyrimidine pyrophosphatase-like HAD family hydrolase